MARLRSGRLRRLPAASPRHPVPRGRPRRTPSGPGRRASRRTRPGRRLDAGSAPTGPVSRYGGGTPCGALRRATRTRRLAGTRALPHTRPRSRQRPDRQAEVVDAPDHGGSPSPVITVSHIAASAPPQRVQLNAVSGVSLRTRTSKATSAGTTDARRSCGAGCPTTGIRSARPRRESARPPRMRCSAWW